MKMMMRLVHSLSLILSLVLVAPLAVSAQDDGAANDDEGRVHFRLGTAYYESGRFRQAAAEYQQAYDLSRRPALLYNIFLAWRDAGDVAQHIVDSEIGLPSATWRAGNAGGTRRGVGRIASRGRFR